MAKVAKIWDGTAWVDLATSVPDLSNYQLKSETGLQLVKKQTIGTAVSSVTVNDAFNSTYDNYKIIVSGGTASGGAELRLTMTGSTANYAYQLNYALYGGTSVSSLGSASNSFFDYVGYVSSTISMANFDLIAPNRAQHTILCNAAYSSGGATGTTNGYHGVATAYTGFTLTTSANTLTGGTIYVYGYKKG